MAPPFKDIDGNVIECPTREQVEEAIRNSDSFAEAAGLLRINERSLRNLRSKYDIAKSQISDDGLRNIIVNFAQQNPACGEKLRKGFFRSQGIKVVRSRVREFVRIHDPHNHYLRSLRKKKCIRRRIYVSPGINFIWHMDGWHKLNPYGFVVHGCIDGLSRFLIFMHCSTNNRSSTVVLRSLDPNR